MSYNIGVLIPSTTKNNNCSTYKETFFHRIFLQSFLKTINDEHNYVIYLITDDDDPIYSQEEQREHIKNAINQESVDIKFLSCGDIPKGWVTKMWNKAFQIAYNDGCDYFYQCGDDIEFKNNHWVNFSLLKLLENDNIGVTGPTDGTREPFVENNGYRFLLTQSFVSRKHMDIFGFYFPTEIKNWFCDDWITLVYSRKNMCYKLPVRIYNKGGLPRYKPDGDGKDMPRMIKLCDDLIDKYEPYIDKYIKKVKEKKQLNQACI